MRACVWAATTAALLALTGAAASARRFDQDFEFDDDADISPLNAGAASNRDGAHSRRPRRYVYDPHNSLCQSLVCKKREVCLLRDAFTALCAIKKEILRKGDVIVSAAGWGGSRGAAWEPGRDRGQERGREREREREEDDDVFYDGTARDVDVDPDHDFEEPKPDRCVACSRRTRPRFLCGSDNRTYSSLCRLDLHNCVRRAARPVSLACRGFCPCAPLAPHAPYQDYDHVWKRRESEASYNEVLPEKSSRRRPSQGSKGCALDEMADRLLDWFSVLMEEAKATAPPQAGFPRECKPEVRWMFAHLDADGDGLLSAADLYSLRHDERERCLRPFLSSCGMRSGGVTSQRAAGVTRTSWCACLRRAARPCTALARAHPAPHPGAYVPMCDARGFYRARQCHAALGVCWCVDAHGVELPGSRTKGAPACPGEPAEAAGAPADDEDADAAGSGDAELRFQN